MWIPWKWGLVIAAAFWTVSTVLVSTVPVPTVLVSTVPVPTLMGRMLARRSIPHRKLIAAALREASVVMVLYSLWQVAGAWSVMGVDDALARGRWVIRFQDTIGLPSERSLQRLVLRAPWLVRSSNLYYAIVHVPALVATLMWGFFAHRQLYSRLRNTLVITTAGCLAIQLIPLAPPRMFPELGFVDTGELYGQSVYNALGRGMAGQLAAMPSVHVAWAVIVSVFAVWFPCRLVWKIVGVTHGVLTVLVVAATGNHFWLDGIVAALIMALALGVLQLASPLQVDTTPHGNSAK
jgi:PAP2 superfamily